MANINLTCYDNAEKYLAKFIGSEAAITLSSGMLAGKIAVDILKENTNVFYHFKGNHEAISVKNSLPFYIDNKINPKLLDNVSESITILTDGVLSGRVIGFDQALISNISACKKITLLIDESHSLGILGNNGSGIFSTINHPNLFHIIMVASLGKAFGTTGGVIAGSYDFIESVRQNPIYGSSAGMNPGFAQSISEANAIVLDQHRKLKQNLLYIDSHLKKNAKVLFDQNYPLIYPNIEDINQKFLQNDIIITNFKYPNSYQQLNRIVVTANHTTDDLNQMIAVLNQ